MKIELKRCLYCNKVIPIGTCSTGDYNRKKFCNNSCAASYNNHLRKKKKYCPVCGKEIPLVNKYCSSECYHEGLYRDFIKQWKSGNKSGMIGVVWKDVSDHIRRYLLEKYDNKCAKCGWSEINPFTGTLPLEIDHVDGDATNNDESNLILLCPNCHSLTSTYRGANKGRGKRNIQWVSRS